jgi:plastocyanin
MQMKRFAIFGFGLLFVVALQAVRARLAPAAEAGLEVHGAVTLLRLDGGRQQIDESEVVEWLAPLDSVPATEDPSEGHYEMVQKDKRFEPSLLVVPVGSVVTFPNRDPWFHNVFSLYRGKRFDLGLYQAGDAKTVRFDRLGPSYIFCNIHPQMAAVILTVDSKYFALSDRFGRVTLPSVPAGRYRMHVWYQNADAGELQTLGKDVTIGEERSLPNVSIQVVPHDLRDHKNKYGQNYDMGALAPNY